jgi:hypothetical protein
MILINNSGNKNKSLSENSIGILVALVLSRDLKIQFKLSASNVLGV